MESFLPLQHRGPHHLCERALQLPGGQRKGIESLASAAGWGTGAGPPLRRVRQSAQGERARGVNGLHPIRVQEGQQREAEKGTTVRLGLRKLRKPNQ